MFIIFSGLKSLLQDECSAWELTKSGLAELIGTAMLVFLGCMGCVGSLGNQPALLQVSFVFGLTVMLIIQVSNLSIDTSDDNYLFNIIYNFLLYF